MAKDDNEMTKEDRKRSIVEWLHERDMVLPPKAIHHNMRRHGAIISISTVRRHLRELDEEGYVEQPEDLSGWYRVSEKGIEWLGERD